MDHLISKARSSEKLLNLAESLIMLSVLLVVVVAALRMSGIVR
jgi:hypothetical protein